MGFSKWAVKALAISTLIFLLLTSAQAAEYEEKVTGGVVGNYVGLQVGSTILHASDEYLMNTAGDLVLVRPSTHGFGFRLYWGYQFIKYLAMEGGYEFYSPATYNIPNGNSPELRIQALDFVGKGVLPLYWGLSAFVKAGMALVFYKQAGLLAPLPPNQSGEAGSNSVTARPEFGFGASYAFTPNWSVDGTYTRITKGGIVPSSDMLTIGISYHAVDLYCGQFLC